MAQVIPLSEGSFTVDRSKSFLPFHSGKDDLQERSKGSLLVEVQPFLLISDGKYILLDTGLGFSTEEGILQLHHNLTQHDVKPEDISMVLMSHLHKDHTGGMNQSDDKEQQVLSFPNATYYICGKEWEYAMEQQGTSYKREQLEMLKEHAQVEFFDGNGELTPAVHHELSGGHCPYHQVFWIKDKEGIYFYGGDVAPQYSQMLRRFMAKYDYDGKKSRALREEYLEKGRKGGWTFLFYHDIQTPYYIFKNQ